MAGVSDAPELFGKRHWHSHWRQMGEGNERPVDFSFLIEATLLDEGGFSGKKEEAGNLGCTGVTVCGNILQDNS